MGESTDKGLADMETGSEVYMSELLVSNRVFWSFSDQFVFARLASTWKTSTKQKR